MIFSILLILSIIHVGKSIQIYVSPTANCSQSNGNSNYPYCNLKAALNTIQSGGNVFLMEGTYKGNNNTNLTIQSGSLIYIASLNGPANTTIDCENINYGMNLLSGNFTIQGLTF
jgi:hypothetical protein